MLEYLLSYSDRLFVFCLVLFIIYNFIKDVLMYYWCKRAVEETVIAVDSRLGYIIGIVAKIRVGKTSLAAALTHLLTLIIKGKAAQDMMESMIILNELDYNLLNEDIHNLYLNKYHEDDIYYQLYDKYALYLQGSFYDGLDDKPLDYYFKRYINAICSEFDNNYVASNTKITSRITGSPSKTFLMDDLKIKVRYELGDRFVIKPYKVYVNDESANTDEAHQHHNIAKLDEGIATAMRFFGQMTKERSYLIIITQDLDRKVLEQRQLITSICDIEKLIIIEYTSLRWILNILRSIYTFIYNTYCFIIHPRPLKRSRYKNRPNLFKRFDKVFFKLQQRVFSKGWLRWNVRIYYKSEDVGSKNTPNNQYYDEFSFFAPMRYSFGTYDTHYYSFISDAMSKKCNLTWKDIKDGVNSFSLDENNLPAEIEIEHKKMINEILTRRFNGNNIDISKQKKEFNFDNNQEIKADDELFKTDIKVDVSL